MIGRYWKIGLIALYFIVNSEVMGQQCLSTGNGNWNNTSSWSCDGVNRLPTCGDTILVQNGDVISVTNQNDYIACGQLMILDVSGDLAFTNGNKIDLPCNSVLSIQDGGEVYKSSPGGGTSTLISICGTNVWTAGDGPLSGPVSYGGQILPIELVSFRAFANQEGYDIRWTTASETNNDYYTLYNSLDGVMWVEVLKHAGAGNSSRPLDYHIILNAEDADGAYFKLEQTDYNGDSEDVGFAMVVKEQEEIKTVVWPNPTQRSINIDVSNFESTVEISLSTLEGMHLHSSLAHPSDVTKTLDLSWFELKYGIYLLSLKDQFKHEVLKIHFIPL